MIYLLLAGVVLLFGYEFWAAANGKPGDTISEIALAFARRHPVLPFAVGFVLGHLFSSQS